jgi:hypothetical protein
VLGVRWFVRPQDRLPHPEVRQTDDRAPVLVGTIAWAVLAVIAFLAHDDLARHDHEWWAWVAVSGAVLGVLGLRLLQGRHNRRTAADGTAEPA